MSGMFQVVPMSGIPAGGMPGMLVSGMFQGIPMSGMLVMSGMGGIGGIGGMGGMSSGIGKGSMGGDGWHQGSCSSIQPS